MTFINPIYKTRKIKKYVQTLSEVYGRKSYEDLSQSDRYEFAGLLIDAVGDNNEHECLVESGHLNKTIAALRKALAGTREDNEELLYVIKENTVNFYEPTMESIFNEVVYAN